MQISYLADHPEFVPTLAEWFHAQWSDFLPGTVEFYADRIRAHLNRDALPLTLVAHAGAELLGAASLRVGDMDTRAELTPWLGGVYVGAAARRRGVGAALVRAVEAKAVEMGFPVIYLYTQDKDAWYRGLGWRTREHTVYHDQPVVVMEREIGVPTAHIVYLRQGPGVVLTKKPYRDWRQIQDEYEHYMASLGPWPEEDIVEFFREDFREESRWPFSRQQIRDFFLHPDRETVEWVG